MKTIQSDVPQDNVPQDDVPQDDMTYDAQLRNMRMNVFKNGKKFSTTKILMVAAILMAITVTIYTLVIIAITKDTSPLAYLIPAVFVDSSASFKFYCDKESAENKIKLMIQYGITPEHNDFTGNNNNF